ncbi:hypothetical protein [Caballeronia sp. GAWG1-1]|uniref:hypothetical protein n=1 Tax=Caballeronia sp. GAWG1-1 TaxID=2921742 RepID=UPI00202896F3|nr:hypothetical protein [Caballeronia sp. GAWG1-1]
MKSPIRYGDRIEHSGEVTSDSRPKTIKDTLFFAALLACSASAFSASPNSSGDAFSQCMARTSNDRLTCGSGCGMILHQCYEEGVSELNRNSEKIVLQINNVSSSCVTVAKDYLSIFSQASERMKKEAADQPGWLEDELDLHFAKQQLATLKLLLKECR